MPGKKNKSGKYSKATKKGMIAAKKQDKRVAQLERIERLKLFEQETYTNAPSYRNMVKSERHEVAYGKPMNKPSVKEQVAPAESQFKSNSGETWGVTTSSRSSARVRSQANACANPNCRQCKEQRNRERIELPKYYTGLRVTVSGIEPRRITATILNLSGVPKGHLAVCFDTPIDPDVADYSLGDLTKPGYGMFVPKESVRILEDQSAFITFQRVPSHVGVVVIEDTKVDDVAFEAGQTGRIVMQPQGADGRVMVNWNFDNKNFYDAGRSDDAYRQDVPRDNYPCCYNVPRNLLAFCRLDSKGRASAIWPNSGEQGDDTPWKKGDFLRLLVAEPQRIVGGDRNFRISPGTIVKYQGQVDRYKAQVTLAGGCDPAILGVPTIVSAKGLEKLEEEFIDAGGEVEITATISFRKRDLKGMRAVVVLPLDQDGEVGLQFKEDIEAGSLDGHGENKRCLYVHHSDVKRVSG